MAKSRLFYTPRPPIQTTVYRAEAQLFPHFRSSEAAVTCDPNGRPLTTELQAVSGFPGQPALIADCSFRRRRSRRNLRRSIGEHFVAVNREMEGTQPS